MLHAGAEPATYESIRALETPVATATHVPIPHFRVVDLVAHALGYYGHQVAEQHFGITPDGMRFFGVLCLKSEYTGYSDGRVRAPQIVLNFRKVVHARRVPQPHAFVPEHALSRSAACVVDETHLALHDAALPAAQEGEERSFMLVLVFRA